MTTSEEELVKIYLSMLKRKEKRIKSVWEKAVRLSNTIDRISLDVKELGNGRQINRCVSASQEIENIREELMNLWS